MIPYAKRACFFAAQLRTLVRAQGLVDQVSDTWGNELRCHELARAVQHVLADNTIVVVDGHCGPVEHSWLRFSDDTILDPYVPGRLPSVQLIDAVVAAAYRVGTPRRDICRSIVDRLVAEMQPDRQLDRQLDR